IERLVEERVAVPGDLPGLGEGVAEVARHVAADVQRQRPVHRQGECHSGERRENDLAAPNIRPVFRSWAQSLAETMSSSGRTDAAHDRGDSLMTYLLEQAITQVTDDELLIPGGLGSAQPDVRDRLARAEEGRAD